MQSTGAASHASTHNASQQLRIQPAKLGLSQAVMGANLYLPLRDHVKLAPGHASLLHRMRLSGDFEIGVKPLIDALFRNRWHGMTESVIE